MLYLGSSNDRTKNTDCHGFTTSYPLTAILKTLTEAFTQATPSAHASHQHIPADLFFGSDDTALASPRFPRAFLILVHHPASALHRFIPFAPLRPTTASQPAPCMSFSELVVFPCVKIGSTLALLLWHYHSGIHYLFGGRRAAMIPRASEFRSVPFAGVCSGSICMVAYYLFSTRLFGLVFLFVVLDDGRDVF